jgi:CRISPR/Cas system-associated exonuclease Cas4 (RecB family)
VSKYYKGKRTRNIYTPGETKPFKLSRSKIDRYIECPRCFYIDRRLGVDRPPGFPFNLNNAVDTLLKKEFDIHRTENTQHPLLERYSVDARPVAHEDLNTWRQNFVGIQHLHESTNLIITGAIDDLWQEPGGAFVVVDYKATSKNDTIDVLDQPWHAGYKRQMEIYQWLLRRNGLEVSDTGYFVYANGATDRAAFDAQLEFELTLIPYTGHDDWIEGTLEEIYGCLNKNHVPAASHNCDYCRYRYSVAEVTT